MITNREFTNHLQIERYSGASCKAKVGLTLDKISVSLYNFLKIFNQTKLKISFLQYFLEKLLLNILYYKKRILYGRNCWIRCLCTDLQN